MELLARTRQEHGSTLAQLAEASARSDAAEEASERVAGELRDYKVGPGLQKDDMRLGLWICRQCLLSGPPGLEPLPPHHRTVAQAVLSVCHVRMLDAYARCI